MALKNCRECGQQVSNTAKVCPQCGAKRPVKPNTSVFTWAIAVLVVLGVAGALLGGGSENPARFRELGYFKDANNHRLFTLQIADDVTPEQARAHAERLPNTANRFMAAYFYPEGSTVPADVVSSGTDFIAVSDMLHEEPGMPPWRFVFIRSMVGGPPQFVDCRDAPDKDLCRD
jgi:DNA-directed RNA polymerase subunit RPC12/RpoP